MTDHAAEQQANQAGQAGQANPVVDAEAQAQAEAAAKATAKKDAKPPKEAKPPRPSLQEANGVTRPADPLSKTGQVWAMADKLSRDAGRPIERKAVMEALKATVNLATIATQYGKWRHFNGLKGVKIEAPKPVTATDPAAAAAGGQQQADPASTSNPGPSAAATQG